MFFFFIIIRIVLLSINTTTCQYLYDAHSETLMYALCNIFYSCVFLELLLFLAVH